MGGKIFMRRRESCGDVLMVAVVDDACRRSNEACASRQEVRGRNGVIDLLGPVRCCRVGVERSFRE